MSMTQAEAEELFDTFDSDGSGRISNTELVAFFEKAIEDRDEALSYAKTFQVSNKLSELRIILSICPDFFLASDNIYLQECRYIIPSFLSP